MDDAYTCELKKLTEPYANPVAHLFRCVLRDGLRGVQYWWWQREELSSPLLVQEVCEGALVRAAALEATDPEWACAVRESVAGLQAAEKAHLDAGGGVRHLR